MLSVYAAWTDGSLEADVAAIRRAMQAPADAVRDGAVCRVVRDNDSVSPQRRRPGRKRSETQSRAATRPQATAADLAIDLQ
jgi:hypothetical protein